jgi:hypothetical protein
MSADREVIVEADFDDNTAIATITATVEISELFNDAGELRLWQDDAGWNGYLRDQDDDEPRFYHVNTRHDEEHWIRKVRVGEDAVRNAVIEHIKDPEAGGRGNFVRRCSPP